MQKIMPCIWFNGTAEEAAEFYTSTFGGGISAIEHYPTEGLPEFQAEMAGKVLTVLFDIDGYVIQGINAGPEYPVNPAISFMLNFDPSQDADARGRLDRIWARLTDGGQVLMDLGQYPFSQHYGWVADRFGVSWQLMVTDPAGDPRPFVIPSLMFSAGAQGKASAAIEHYTALFGGRIGTMMRQPDDADQVMFADFTLADQWFTAMDSAGHSFTFSPGVSLSVACRDQAEIDRFWSALSAVPEAEQCGWLVDRFGVSWQIVPANMSELMSKPGAYDTMMAMHKIEIAKFG